MADSKPEALSPSADGIVTPIPMDEGDSVQVVCRARPQNSRETSGRSREVVTVSEDDGTVSIAAVGKQFSFDTVLGPDSSQVCNCIPSRLLTCQPCAGTNCRWLAGVRVCHCGKTGVRVLHRRVRPAHCMQLHIVMTWQWHEACGLCSSGITAPSSPMAKRAAAKRSPSWVRTSGA